MGLFDRCFGKKSTSDGEEEGPVAEKPPGVQIQKPPNARQTMVERSASEEDEIAKMYQARIGKGRKSVSAERYDPTQDEDDGFMPKIIPKSDKQRQRLQETSTKIMLLSRLDQEQLSNVLDAMEEKKVESGEIIIQQGADGDNFYIIESGSYDIIIDDNKVGAYEGTGSFGELALMYNTPRAATITATSTGTLWILDRQTFRQIIVKANAEKKKRFEGFLRSVELLENINESERAKIADVMESKKYSQNDIIIKQGDKIDAESYVYFLMSGTVSVVIDDREIKQLEAGSYFGEMALITKNPRGATIKVESQVATAGVLDINAFERLLGSVKERMESHMGHYDEEVRNVEEQAPTVSDVPATPANTEEAA